MSDPITTALAELDATSASSTFACRLKLPGEALTLSVDGVGGIRLPVSKTRAKALVRIARPAPFGHRDRTLVDRRVRDVWEVAKSRVRIDARPWKAVLGPALEEIRATLGLPAGRLEAKLHKLLVYEPGQFFQPHRDTERDDTMVGTLVVVLPSAHRGGTLVVQHAGETRRFVARQSADNPLTLLAFYADCTHEVKPVSEGYRVVLSHELHFVPDADASRAVDDEEARNPALERALESFFDPERAPVERWRRPVEKLVYLLDHEYSPRSLSWARLKGADSVRVSALERAARALGLHRHLALVTVEESWSASKEGEGEDWYEEDWYDEDDEQQDDDEEDEPRAGSTGGQRDGRTVGMAGDAYELEELLDRGASLEHWIGADGRPADLSTLRVADDELRWLTGFERFEPVLEEYEGWMGNYGNTLERQYRRAAVVLWPVRSHHRIRARMGAGPFVRELLAEARAGQHEAAREAVRSVLDDWPTGGLESDACVLGDTLALLDELDDAILSAGLLSGFHLTALEPVAMPALIALGERHGADFCRALFDRWAGGKPSTTPRGRYRGDDYLDTDGRLDWLEHFPDFCREVQRTGSDAWSDLPNSLLERLLAQTLEEHAAERHWQRPSERRETAPAEARQLIALLEAARVIDAGAIAGSAASGKASGRAKAASRNVDDAATDTVFDALREHHDDYLPETLVDVFEHFSRIESDRGQAFSGSFDRRLAALQTRAAETLRAALEKSERAAGDWSIEAALDCDCEDCRTLAEFLASREEQALDLPLNKGRRAHLHRKIDERELPVDHVTRRKGSPYVLQLRKREELFELSRRQHEHELALMARLEE